MLSSLNKWANNLLGIGFLHLGRFGLVFLNLQMHSLKIVSATVSASLFGIEVTMAYFVKPSVMQSTKFLLLSAVIIGPNKSTCMC
jgi:hypothetical protein